MIRALLSVPDGAPPAAPTADADGPGRPRVAGALLSAVVGEMRLARVPFNHVTRALLKDVSLPRSAGGRRPAE